MPKFINEKEGTLLGKLPFCNTDVPILDMEGELRLRWAPYTGSLPDYEKDCVIIGKNEGYAGVYTGCMSACHALTMVERNDKGEITRIAMQHFSGGINKDMLEKFVSHCKEKGFKDNLELVHYPGNAATGDSDKEFEEILKKEKFKGGNEIQRIYHADLCMDCCVMFNGQIGNAQFATYELSEKFTQRQFNLSGIIESKARDNFQNLIRNQKDPNKAEQLETLMTTILNDKLCDNPHKLLEKTRQLIVKAELSPQAKKEELYNDYAKEVKKQPYLSTATKIACVALAATIIGIIPAVIIASRYKNEVKELRENQLKTMGECLSISNPSPSPGIK